MIIYDTNITQVFNVTALALKKSDGNNLTISDIIILNSSIYVLDYVSGIFSFQFDGTNI